MAHGGHDSADEQHVPSFGFSPEADRDGKGTYMAADMRLMKIILAAVVVVVSALMLFVGDQKMGIGTFIGGVLVGLGALLFIGVFSYIIGTAFMTISGMRRLARIFMVAVPFIAVVAVFWWFAATHTLN